MKKNIEIRVAQKSDIQFSQLISSWYKASAQERGTGIAIRSPEYLEIA